MELISTTSQQDEDVITAYGDGTHPFTTTPPLEDEQLRDALGWFAKDQFVGLVDEEAGGIIGYVNNMHADRIAGLLNAAAVHAAKRQ